MEDRRKCNLIPLNDERNDQLKARATVKKLGEAGQPYRTPRSKSKSVPVILFIRTLALASK